jgi:AraC-like DNA-binding protein
MHLMELRNQRNWNSTKTRHVHAEHELLAVSEGHGWQLTGRHELPCATGDVFVFPAGSPHMSHSRPGESFSCLVFNGDARGARGDGGELFDMLAERVPGGGRLQLRPAAAQRAIALLRRATAEWESRDLGARHAARALATELLVVLARDACTVPAAPRDGEAADNHVARARRWIEDYWMTPVRIADLVALGSLGRSQFLARFRHVVGATVGDALLAIRLREAQRLMREGRLNLLDVALACGFGSQSHFNHRFKQATGLSPRAWLGVPG